MSRLRAIRLVAMRELIERGRSRAFLVSLVTTVVLLGVGAVMPSLIGGPGKEHLGIVGTPPAQFDTALGAVAAATNVGLVTEQVPDETSGHTRLEDGSLSGLLVVAPDGGSARYIVKERKNELLGQVVAQAWAAARTQQVLVDRGVDPATLAAAATPPTVTELEPSDPNRETSFLFANVGGILLFISIF